MRQPPRSAAPASDDPAGDRAIGRRPRPRRLVIGFALIAIGLSWSILNAELSPRRGAVPAVPVVHGPAVTHVQSIGGLRVRPELAPGAVAGADAEVTISFHNSGGITRLVSSGDVQLLVAGRDVASAASGAHAIGTIALAPGHVVTGALRFAYGLAPGATLVFRPPWAGGHELRWVLWR